MVAVDMPTRIDRTGKSYIWKADRCKMSEAARADGRDRFRRYRLRQLESMRRMRVTMTEFATNPMWGAGVNEAAALALVAVKDAVQVKRSPRSLAYIGKQDVDPD